MTRGIGGIGGIGGPNARLDEARDAFEQAREALDEAREHLLRTHIETSRLWSGTR